MKNRFNNNLYIFFVVFFVSIMSGIMPINAVENSLPNIENTVDWLYDNGLTSKPTVTTFRPNDFITREQAAKFYSQLAVNIFKKIPNTKASCNFYDINKADKTLKDYIVKSCQLGLFFGVDGYFKYNDNLTNAQAITVLVRLLDGIKNEKVSPWYKEYFNTINELKILDGMTINLSNAEHKSTRGDAGKMMYKSFLIDDSEGKMTEVEKILNELSVLDDDNTTSNIVNNTTNTITSNDNNTNPSSLIKYIKNVDIPFYDSNNVSHCLATNDSSLSKYLNNKACIYVYVNPGTYTTKEIRAGYSNDYTRYIVLNRNDDTHPAKLFDSEQASVPLAFAEGSKNWIIDRISVLNYTKDSSIKIRKYSKNIVLNRMHIKNFDMAIHVSGPSSNVGDYTSDITIQNSRLDTMTDAAIDDDNSAIYISASPTNAATTKIANLHIINNEIVNSNDGIMPAKYSGGSYEADYQGLVIHNNYIYVDERVYTNCKGYRDTNGLCSHTEDAIDLKSGSENPENPIIISNNYLWGFRKTDTLGGGSSSFGGAIVVHFKTKNVIIKNNVIFNSNDGIVMADADGFKYSAENVSITNNIIANSTRLESETTPGYEGLKRSFRAISATETLNTTIQDNIIVGKTQIYSTDTNGNLKSLRPVGTSGATWLYVYVPSKERSDCTVGCSSDRYTNNENLQVKNNLVIDMFQINRESKPFLGSVTINNNYFYNLIPSSDSQKAEDNGIYGTIYPSGMNYDMRDLTFVADNFTNNPRTITIKGVVSSN